MIGNTLTVDVKNGFIKSEQLHSTDSEQASCANLNLAYLA